MLRTNHNLSSRHKRRNNSTCPVAQLTSLLLLFSLNFTYYNSCVILFGGLPKKPEIPTKSEPPTKSTISVFRHIVIAHCRENLSWLDQLHNFDSFVCQHCHLHIYSACSMFVDLNSTIPAMWECTTLHRSRNHGSEEYAYFRYIEDMYDNFPPFISFIQGGGITEIPHLIYMISWVTIFQGNLTKVCRAMLTSLGM